MLLWMSMSYGFTNFTWIWLWLSKDKHLLEWSLLTQLVVLLPASDADICAGCRADYH